MRNNLSIQQKFDMKLSDRVAVITGGAQGLGKSIALAMAREGATIVICDINPNLCLMRRQRSNVSVAVVWPCSVTYLL